MTPIRPRSCDNAREWASVRLDSELSEFEGFLLDEHLNGCSDCAAYAAAIGTTTTALRETPPLRVEVPVSLPFRRRVLPLRAISLASAAAAVAAAVGIGTLVGSVGHSPKVVGPRIARSAVTSQPGGMQGLIEQPKLAMLHAKVGIGKQRGLGIADV
jgi:predicted anti-sigma-YlaC factor YlaD